MKTTKKMGMGGMHKMSDGSMMKNSMMKNGGSANKMKCGGMMKAGGTTKSKKK